ncbi:hypothetical protein [Pseudoalteromonas arctica]|uniref:Uncharacterized protein n=1 Tax=Pseudoalteromonas arctica TaxID=394751 RepID=A0A7Y0HD27_9GAMM|nr:hypothetical protein [Pseudoalteromonas arctica]NMM40734.1 hypothetical protein [Pseudoalteromonas arctica]
MTLPDNNKPFDDLTSEEQEKVMQELDDVLSNKDGKLEQAFEEHWKTKHSSSKVDD